MKTQAALFNGNIGPDFRHEFPLAHHRIGAGRQGDQRIEGSRAQLHGSIVRGQQSFTWKQLKTTK
jgi:hypothetical protein